jgi:uncharacterized protein YfiM (DUF2279 family)
MNTAARALVAALAAAALSTAHADAWTGPDKTMHFGIGAAIGSAGTLIFKNPNAGLVLGVAAGAAKEAYDAQHRDAHTVSAKDFAVTALGAFLGSKATGWAITPRRVTYRRSF